MCSIQLMEQEIEETEDEVEGVEEADEMDEADVEEEEDVEEADEAERTMYKRLQLFLTDVSAYSRSRTRVLRSFGFFNSITVLVPLLLMAFYIRGRGEGALSVMNKYQ